MTQSREQSLLKPAGKKQSNVWRLDPRCMPCGPWRFIVLVAGLWGGVACGGTELSDQRPTEPPETLGESCESTVQDEMIEVASSETCGEGVCLSRGQDAACSCRCSGPEGTGPFCGCPSGFYCQDEVVADLGVGRLDEVGGYCVPLGQ